KLNVIMLTKVRGSSNETLFLRGAQEAFAVKNAYCLSFYRDNARPSQFTQRGGYGFSVDVEVPGQIFMRHTCHHAVLRLFQQQGCETRNQTLTGEDFHPVEKVHASLAHQVDNLVCHMRSAF